MTDNKNQKPGPKASWRHPMNRPLRNVNKLGAPSSFLLLILLLIAMFPVALEAQSFRRGDANDSNVVDLSDAVFGLNYLFTGGSSPTCLDASDSNDDGAVDISDSVAILTFLFAGGVAPAAPFPECGPDPTADGLGCAAYTHCTSCYGQRDLETSLQTSVDPIVCVPGGSVEPLAVGGFLVTVCPLNLAAPCPLPESPTKGCPVEFTQLVGTLDVPARSVTIHIEGFVPDFPILVEDTTFGTKTGCRIDIEFQGDVLVPFTVDGDLVILDIAEPTLEESDIQVSTKNSEFICKAIVALKGLFTDQLIAQLQAASSELLVDLRQELLGKSLCPGG